jgi:hypothetical protein
MLMTQFPPEDFHFNLLHALRSRRTTTSVLVPRLIKKGHELSPAQAGKNIMSPATKIKSVSIFQMEDISLDSSEFNWRDYYSRTLTALMNDIDETPQGE